MNFIHANKASCDSAPAQVLKRARKMLGARKLDPVHGDQPRLVAAADAATLWRHRLGNTDITGQTLHGAEALLGQLQTLPPAAQLEQFAFTTDTKAIVMFFEHTDGPFVGSILVHRRPGASPSP